MLAKRSYLSLRKANKQETLGNSKLPNFVSYKVLSRYIGSIDIGKLCQINEHFGIKQEKVGLLSSAAEYILHLASYYLKVDLVREDRLHVFLKIPKKDPDSVLFALAIGGNGAITWEKG